MTTPDKTAYPTLTHLEPEDIVRVFTPSEADLKFIDSIATGPGPQTALMVHLQMLRALGRMLQMKEVHVPIRDHIAQCLGFARSPTLAELGRFERSGGKVPKIKRLRQYLDIRALDTKGFVWLAHEAEQAAEIHHSVADIVNVLLEQLVRHRYELPAFSTLNRAAHNASENSNDNHFNAITSKLGPKTKAMIDQMLKVEPSAKTSAWHSLKREPKRPTNKETRQYLQHVETLKALFESLPKPEIPAAKLRQFRLLARQQDAAEMAKLKPLKRYALAVVFIQSQYATSLDDAALLFIRLMGNMENNAKERLVLHLEGRTDKNEMLFSQLLSMLEAYALDGTKEQRFDAIEGSLRKTAQDLIQECREALAYQGQNYLPFMIPPYKPLRAQLLNCLLIAGPTSSSNDRVNEHMLEVLRKLTRNRLEVVSLADLDLKYPRDFGWMSHAWRKLVFVRGPDADDYDDSRDHVDRRYLELAILQMVRDELKSADLILKHGEQFGDYNEELVDNETLAVELPHYAEVTEMETDPAACVELLKARLTEAALVVDEKWPETAHAEIVDGRLVLRKPLKLEDHPDETRFKAELDQRMRPMGILDVLVLVERWLDLHKMFRPLAGTDSRIDELRARVVMVLFCYGCNLGPTQLARSVRGMSAKRLAWVNHKYCTEDLLEKVITKVNNEYAKFELPQYWGSADHASSDGTKFNLYEKNLTSEYHIRYGSYGGIGYYRNSSQYIALVSHFITCGTYEGHYFLDQFRNPEAEYQPTKLHGDTHQQSYPIFSMAWLIGIEVMPRIRDIHDLDFFRPTASTKYDNIDSLFKGIINWKLIETHLPQMFRIGVSIKMGRLSPSTILRRLGTHSRKNKLFFAFQELGKALRTIFLLRYIGDVELRRFINAETNKTEQFNAFVKWSFFGNGGLIAENVRYEQQKLIKFNHLVANMIIFYNVQEMSRVIRELKEEGFPITPELLSEVNPYRIGHINLLGDYLVNMKQAAAALHADEPILGKEAKKAMGWTA